jgi:hypothetical protein
MTFAINMFEETVANWFNQLKKWVPLGPTGAQRCPGIIDPQCDAVETCRAAGQELFCHGTLNRQMALLMISRISRYKVDEI